MESLTILVEFVSGVTVSDVTYCRITTPIKGNVKKDNSKGLLYCLLCGMMNNTDLARKQFVSMCKYCKMTQNVVWI